MHCQTKIVIKFKWSATFIFTLRKLVINIQQLNLQLDKIFIIIVEEPQAIKLKTI